MGAYFGKTSKGWFFGFKLHLLVTATGLIVNVILTPGNWDDRDAAPALMQAVSCGSAGLGDRGYRRPALQDELWEEEAELQTEWTPSRKREGIHPAGAIHDVSLVHPAHGGIDAISHNPEDRSVQSIEHEGYASEVLIERRLEEALQC